MNHTVLLQKLIAIEQSIGTATNSAMRDLVRDAQTYLLIMQRERAESFYPDPWHHGSRRFQLQHESLQNRIA